MHTNKRFGNMAKIEDRFDWYPGIFFIRPIISKPGSENYSKNLLNSNIHGSLKPVLPFLKVIHISPLVSNGIEFDPIKKAFICKESSKWKKAFSITWLLSLCMYISLVIIFDSQDGATTKAIIGRIAWLIYSILYFNFVKCFWKRGFIMADILTTANILSFDLDLVVGENSKTCKGNRRTWTVCIFMLMFIGLFVLTNVPAFTANTTSLYAIFMKHTCENGALLMCEYNDYLCNLVGRGFQNPFAFLVVFFWFLVAYSTNFIWLMWLMLLNGWGILFKYIVERLVIAIGHGRVELIDGMALYTRVSDLIDKFNETFGSVTLLSVVSQGLYIALMLSDFVGGSKRVHLVDGVNLMSSIPLFGMLYSASEVNRVGNLLPTAIKHIQRVESFDSAVSNDNDSMIVMRGIQIARIIQYDSLSNNIGFKGMEYFTITYKFVASFIGVIATYSLISLQLTIGEDRVIRLNGTDSSMMGVVHM